MALPPNTDQAFLREVDEELRRDQLASAWTRYGRWLILAILLLLAGLGGFLFWQHSQVQAAGKEGEQLQLAFDDLGAQKPAAASPPLAALAASKIDGYRAAARFTQADILQQKKDDKGAAAKFAEIAGDTSLAQPFRDLALIRQTVAEFDAMKPDMVVQRLRPLAVVGGPWFGSAGELVAAAYLRMNRRDLAGAMFRQISQDQTVPETIRQRSVQMAAAMGADATLVSQEKSSR